MVDSNISFYRQVMPDQWRADLIKWGAENTTVVEALSQQETEAVQMFIDIMADIAPCFVKVVTIERRSWLIREFQEVLQDIQAAETR